MAGWLDDLWGWLQRSSTPSRAKPRPVFRRRFSVSGAMRAWLRDPERTGEDLATFAALLSRLDADPIGHSEPVLRHDVPPGTRWSLFGAWRVVLRLDPAEDRVSLITCHRRDMG